MAMSPTVNMLADDLPLMLSWLWMGPAVTKTSESLRSDFKMSAKNGMVRAFMRFFSLRRVWSRAYEGNLEC